MASSLDLQLGANPPSSPTAVEYPCFFSAALSEWKISTPQRSASEKFGAPTGITMNSWKSTELSACAPPFRMFIIGTGSRFADVSVEYRERYLYSGCFRATAAARAAAMDTARIAF